MWPPGPVWEAWSAARTPPDGSRMNCRRSSRPWTGISCSARRRSRYQNIRRKADARAYPSRLEFGLKGGIVPPTAINSGEEVELLLGRIAAHRTSTLPDFDELPTPFRTVAVDLLSAQPIVMRNGSLADAMRATMSLPLIFPPTQVDGQVLIDGGTMDNVPADVVKAMGASRVIAVNVGDLSDPEGVSYTMLGVGDHRPAVVRLELPAAHRRRPRHDQPSGVAGGCRGAPGPAGHRARHVVRAPRQAAPGRRYDAPAGLAEAVADRAHGLDQVGVLLAELGPQAPDVDVDRAGAAVVLVAPHPATAASRG